MKYIRCSNEVFQFENYPLYVKFKVAPKIKFQYGHSEYFDGISAVFSIGYTYQWFQAGVPVADEKYVFVTIRDSKHQIIGEKCLLQDYFDYGKDFVQTFDTEEASPEIKAKVEQFKLTNRNVISSFITSIRKEKPGAILKLDERLTMINDLLKEIPAITEKLELVKKEASSKTEFWNSAIINLFSMIEKDTTNGN